MQQVQLLRARAKVAGALAKAQGLDWFAALLTGQDGTGAGHAAAGPAAASKSLAF